MALQKSIALPSGIAGNYVRIGYFHWDRMRKEASVHLMLHKSQDFEDPLLLIAKLRLNGPKFDQYLSPSAIAARTQTTDPMRAQFYAAAKSEPLLAGGGLASISLSDAEDV